MFQKIYGSFVISFASLMEIITKGLRKKFPPLYATEHEKDPLVICKFFLPGTFWIWYPTEFDGKDIFFGFVNGDYPELGYFSLSELESTWENNRLGVMLNPFFKPTRLSIVKSWHTLTG